MIEDQGQGLPPAICVLRAGPGDPWCPTHGTRLRHDINGKIVGFPQQLLVRD